MAPHSRRSGWIIASALVVCVLATIGVVLWIWLPRWAPGWVVEYSPWFGPAYRATVYESDPHQDRVRALAHRIEGEWQTSALAVFATEQDNPDKARRGIVIEILARWIDRYRNQAARIALVRYMRGDPDPELRRQAIAAVSGRNVEQILDQVISTTTDADARVRAAAAKAFTGHRAAIRTLIGMLRDPAPEVVVSARESLVRAHVMWVGEELYALLSSTDPRIAYAAWKVLWSDEDPYGDLLARLGHLPVASVLSWIAADQEQSTDQHRVEYRQFNQQVKAWGVDGIAGLASALDGGDVRKRQLASRALAIVLAGEAMRFNRTEDTEFVLRYSFEHDKRQYVVDAATKQGVDVQSVLLRACGDSDEWVRLFALISLRGSTADAVREAAARALEDLSRAVALEAALTLAVLQDGRAYAPLMRVIDGPKNDKTRWLAIEGLAVLGDQRAIGRLITILRDETDEQSGGQAADALGEVGDLQAVLPLIAVLESKREYLAGSAAYSLGQLGDWRATPALIACLDQADRYLCCSAAFALGELGDPRAVPALIRRFRKLVGGGHPTALKKQIENDDQQLIGNIGIALIRIGDPSAVDCLIDMLGEPDEDGFLSELVDGLSRMPLTAEQRSRLCSPSREPAPPTSSVAPATPGSTAPPP